MAITTAAKSPYKDIDFISTGFPKLNQIMGGGVPTRRITEFSGKSGVGKSTLALRVVANAQQDGRDVLWSDTEYSYEERYAASLGVDNEKLELSVTNYAEEALDEMLQWAREHKNGLIVLDSVGGLLSREESEKASGERIIGGQAKLVSGFVRRMVPILAANNNALLVLNHVFIDILSGNTMTSGGAKLIFHKSIEIRLSKSKFLIKQGEQAVGRQIEAKCIKNKLVGTQEQTVMLTMIYGHGFSLESSLLDDAIAQNVIERKGASFFFQGAKIAHGAAKMREMLKDDLFAAKIKQALAEIAV